MKKALLFWGGWDGHEPELVARRFERLLCKNGFETEICEGVSCLADREKLMTLDLLVPVVTGSELPRASEENVSWAVGHGVGMAGCHGGMCDSFRNSTEWQFITGGQWVSHPGGDGVHYTVNVRRGSSPLVLGLEDFEVCSEQYYLHVDPSVEVLATTRFPLVNFYHAANKPIDMPVVWTKYWGTGRIFYCSLGHHDDVFDRSPTAETLMERGMLWASDGKSFAEKMNISPKKYENNAKTY
ncbi:MAG: ThuA domain-containing protein [Clostridia bacterium]|nr:ThuA domain-containing protein [Clostridia bacterium]